VIPVYTCIIATNNRKNKMTTITRATGPRLISLTPNKTYATAENAVKAVAKVYPPDSEYYANLTYIIQQNAEGRFFPVFIGERALQAQVHFHFCVVA
jgi:hypothetical protein